MNGSRALLTTLAFMAVFALAIGPSATAQDHGTTVVRVEVTNRAGESADAWVTLTPQEGGAAHDCHTRNGGCEIRSVPPGRYIVTATPSDEGRPPLPRVVPVPARVATMELRVRLL